jgi:hypothetical protein
MKIIRYNQSCDVEVDMDVNNYGESLEICWKTEDGVRIETAQDYSSAFRILYNIYMNERGVKLPAKFVLEFALMVINGLTPHRNVEWTQSAGEAR